MSLALLLVVLVGAADYFTGHEMLFSSFYLLAVGFGAWVVGRGFGVLLAVLSVVAWLLGDLAAGAVYARAFVPAWNAAIVLLLYLVVVALVSRLREANRVLETRVRERTRDLTDEIAERERLEREVLDIGERERRRIGRDLHDSLGQLLTGTALSAKVIHERLDAGEVPDAPAAERIVHLVEEAIELTRRLARGLDPVEVEGGGLEQGLREMAATTLTLSGVPCAFDARGPVMVRDSVLATHLYRIAQEAVTNAIKHAQPTRLQVRLEGTPGRIRLEVRDDGRGIPSPGARPPGMGLRIMAHRAAVTGGTFEVGRDAERGTRVVVEAPNP
jgi:signal transduction histidine kinase